MGGVDDLFHEVSHRLVADNSTSDEHTIARLRLQLVFETVEAGFGRCLDDLVPKASACHLFLQVTQPYLDLWALLYRDQRMIQR